MRIFIDTEFNSFKGDLISMGLVDINGRSCYFVLPYQHLDIDPWVAEHVIPVLGKTSASRSSCQEWLQNWLSLYSNIHLIADWPEDIQHFCEFLITGPGERLNTPPLTMEIRRDLDAVSIIPHNALEDAKAIRARWFEIPPKHSQNAAY